MAFDEAEFGINAIVDHYMTIHATALADDLFGVDRTEAEHGRKSEARGIDVRAREEPETGVDAVDDAAFGDDRGNRIRSGIDPRLRAALEGDGDRIAPGRTQQIERQAPGRKMQSGHRCCLSRVRDDFRAGPE